MLYLKLLNWILGPLLVATNLFILIAVPEIDATGRVSLGIAIVWLALWGGYIRAGEEGE